MNENEISKVIELFMHPTVFTGVKPLFLVAEEVAIQEHMGDIIDAVWVYWENEEKGDFSYITKFAVNGKILDRGYYSSEEMEPFKGRLALPEQDNLEKMVLHREIKEEIKELIVKRNALGDFVEKDFSTLKELVSKDQEVSLFKKGYGEWTEPFYEINIDAPYSIVEVEDSLLAEGEYNLKHPKTGVIEKHVIENVFYAYIIGAKADIAGLQLKDDSYKKNIETLKDEAKKVFSSIQWLSLNDPRVRSIKQNLPRHPFDEYFKYVKKGDERKLDVPKDLIKAVELMVAEYMPKLDGPMGVEYIPLDNLLFLFHEIIPRADALLALEVCDIVYEPSAVLLGVEGRRELPPKFLVSVPHIVFAYKQFPGFIEACEASLRK